MKLLSTVSLFIALAGASPVLADKAPAKAPAADKKAPPPEKAPDKPMATPEETKHAVAFFDELFAAVVKNQDACPKMGPAITAVIDKHEAWIKKMSETDKELPKDTKDKLEKKQGEMMTAVMKCKDDKGVAAAFQRFAAMTTPKKK
jgi:hypothetical protein